MKPVQTCTDNNCRYFERPGAVNTRRALEIDENIISTGGVVFWNRYGPGFAEL